VLARTVLALAFTIVISAIWSGPVAQRAVLAQPSGLTLTIGYPGDGDKLPYLTRSFIFGSVEPGARVTVNESPALVAPSGGWIAYVPFSPGEFHLHVVARMAGESASADRVVNVALPPRTTPASPAHVDLSMAPTPEQNLVLNPGDSVNLFIKTSTGARVSASLGSTGAQVPLAETSAPSLNPTEKERILGGVLAGGETVGGLFEGELRIPASASGALSVSYAVTAKDGSTARAVAKGTVTVAQPGWYRVGYVVLGDRHKDIDARPYGIVESEPYGGWLFFPPARTLFEVTGSAGDYYRVALGSSQQAWINKHSLELAPLGTPRPHAEVQGIEIRDGSRAGTVVVHMTACIPFSVTEVVNGPSLHVRMYGAAAATDFIRYGEDRSNISAVRWDQLRSDIATIDIKLRQHTLWGYHTQWDGNDLTLVIKKPPPFKAAPAPALKSLLVVIDPGHSPDSGAIGPTGTREEDVNLAISKRLAARLEDLGARAVLTRTANVAVGLYERTELAARVGADILISVHNNALPDGANPFTHHGYSVYYYQPQSLELARAIHDAYRSSTSLPDYGLYYDNLALARPTEEPAVLTESAFIMWPPEEMELRDPAFQDKLAATLARGLSSWASSMRSRELGK
jgi:N-acetylmuramoyl-L-alanine amidase